MSATGATMDGGNGRRAHKRSFPRKWFSNQMPVAAAIAMPGIVFGSVGAGGAWGGKKSREDQQRLKDREQLSRKRRSAQLEDTRMKIQLRYYSSNQRFTRWDFIFHTPGKPDQYPELSTTWTHYPYSGFDDRRPPEYCEKPTIYSENEEQTWTSEEKEKWAATYVENETTDLPSYVQYPPPPLQRESVDQSHTGSVDISTEDSCAFTSEGSMNAAGDLSLSADGLHGLPITIHGLYGPATFVACADSGSEENCIRLEIAQIMGLYIEEDETGRKPFALANGKVITSVGRALTCCQFGKEEDGQYFSCWFYVFQALAWPIIMSDNFIRSNHTMTKNRHRLIELRGSAFNHSIPQAVSVNAVGKTRKRLLCRLDGKPTLAFADSGSQLDLMSASYVGTMGYQVRPDSAQIMFADGSIGETHGIVKLRMAVAKGSASRTSSFLPWTKAKAVRFCVLKDLASDVILGERTLDKFNVFALSEACLITVEATNQDHALNSIRLIGSLEKTASRIKKKLAKFARRRPDQIQVAEESDHAGLVNFQKRLKLRDQRELARRDEEMRRIGKLGPQEKEIAQNIENQRQRLYDDDRKRLIRDFDVTPFEPVLTSPNPFNTFNQSPPLDGPVPSPSPSASPQSDTGFLPLSGDIASSPAPEHVESSQLHGDDGSLPLSGDSDSLPLPEDGNSSSPPVSNSSISSPASPDCLSLNPERSASPDVHLRQTKTGEGLEDE